MDETYGRVHKNNAFTTLILVADPQTLYPLRPALKKKLPRCGLHPGSDVFGQMITATLEALALPVVIGFVGGTA